MRIKIFGQQVKMKGKGRRLAFFGDSSRADWHVVLGVALAAIVAGGFYAETRLGAVRAAAERGELRLGGEDALEVPEATEILRVLDARGAPPLGDAPAEAATATPPAV
jgi:hypothetical protein